MQCAGLTLLRILQVETKRSKCLGFTLLVVAACSLSGCSTNQELKRFNSEFYWGNKSRLAVTVPAKDLIQIANDSGADRDLRRRSVAELFATYIKPGMTSQEIHAALPNTRWLADCRLYNSTASGGGGSLCYRSIEQSLFTLMLFPDDTGWSPWVIDFAVPDDSLPRGETEEEARAILAGTHPDKRLRLGEFCIYYPLCNMSDKANVTSVSERFTARRVGLIILR
jgi:hypothetical protein